MESPILYVKGSQVEISKLCISAKKNSADPGEMLHFVAFARGLH